MKKLGLCLAGCLSLCAADEKLRNPGDANAPAPVMQPYTSEGNAQQSSSEAPKEAKKDSKAKEFLKGFKPKGFAFGRFHTLNGPNGNAQAWQFRVKLDVSTGKLYGFSATGGIMFSQGSGAIDKGRISDGDVQGSRGTANMDNYADRFNISVLYASKEFEFESAGIWANIDAGKLNINSPLTDKSLDIGLGGQATVKHKLPKIGEKAELTYNIQFYDSWISDHAGYNIRRRKPATDTSLSKPIGTNREAAAIGIGNNLTIVSVGGKNLVKDLNFNLLFANVYNLFDFMIMGDLGYKMKFGKHELGFLGQVAFVGMNDTPNIHLGYKGNSAFSNLDKEFASLSARYRGVYNIQLKYKWDAFQAKLGFLGSFAQGYGVLLSNKAGIDTAGKIWNGSLTATYDGLGAFGSGSFRGTDIEILYLTADYKFKFPLKVGLDFALIFGNNNLPLLDVTKTKRPIKNPGTASGNGTNGTSTLVGGPKNFVNATIVEITPSVAYKFVENLEASFYVGAIAGDFWFIKTRTELKYTF